MNESGRDISTPRSIGVVLALFPVVLWLIAVPLAPHGISEPMFVTPPPPPPSLLGISFADLLLAGAVGWGLLGAILVVRSRKPWAFAVGFLVFTVPACVAIILGPAIVLILSNLG